MGLICRPASRGALGIGVRAVTSAQARAPKIGARSVTQKAQTLSVKTSVQSKVANAFVKLQKQTARQPVVKPFAVSKTLQPDVKKPAPASMARRKSGRRGVGSAKTKKSDVPARTKAGGAKTKAGVRMAQAHTDGPKLVKNIAKSTEKVTALVTKMSPTLRAVLDSWGPKLAQKIERARQQWFRQHSGVGTSGGRASVRVRIGTDCSGAEAPIWAMKAMETPHEHVFSCDWQKDVRSFIQSTCPPTGPIFSDMLKRRCEDMPDMDVYVCGFPCTPFSYLRRHSTRLLREAAAKPFFKVVDVLRTRRPKLAVLENVLGIRDVMKKVLGYLLRLQIYLIIVLPIDSQDLGEPVARPRYYFLLVRRDVGVFKDMQKIRALVAALAHAAYEPVTSHIASRLFLKESPCVQHYVKMLSDRFHAVQTGSGSDQKWHKEHEEFRVAHGLKPAGSVSMCLPSQRMRSAWHLWRQHVGENIVGNFGQSINRVSLRTDGVCPTLTPNGMVAVGGRGVNRVITPREKLAVHLFPVHKMNIPKDFPEEQLGKLGGNTMHLKSVGLALKIGLALIDFSLPSASKDALDKLGKAPPAIELPLNTVREGV